VVAAGAEYEEDPIDLDPSQPDAGAAAGAHAHASHTRAILPDCCVVSAAGTSGTHVGGQTGGAWFC